MNRTTRSLFDSVAVAHFVVMACIIFTCGSCSQPNDNASLPFDPSPDNIAVPVTGVPVPNRATAPSQEPVPKTFATWFAEGATALEEGDNETAVIAYTKAIEIDPKSAETLNARGVAFLRMHRTSLALKDFSSAIDLSPAVPKYYGNRALVYGDKNEHSRSIADLTKAIDLDPRSPSWYRQRSEAYQSHGNDALSQADTIKAERLENSSLSSNSSDPPVHRLTCQRKKILLFRTSSRMIAT